jgi:fido (protein-threonine AMPylation protein)
MITNTINQKRSSETHIDSNNIAITKHDNLNPLCDFFSVDTFKWLKDNGFLDSGFEFHNENIQKLHSFAVSKIHNDPIHREEKSCVPSSELRTQDFHGRAFFTMGRGSINSIAESLNEICSWINSTQKNKEGIDPYTFAAEAYIKFIDLHPFEDGNGRTSRLLLNLILIQNDRMPINLKLIDWHNTSLTGYLECLPDDARFFGNLLQNAANGNYTKHSKRYQEPECNSKKRLGGHSNYGANVTNNKRIYWTINW